MRIRLVLVASSLLAGCATTADPAPMPARATTTITSGGSMNDSWTTSVTTSPESGPTTVAIPAAPERVWSALHAAYGDLGIPVETIDNRNLRLGNVAFVRRRHLGNESLARYFACGTNAFGAQLAETERLQIHVTSRVVADGTDSRMETDVRASVLSGAASGTASNCRSRGALEKLIENRVRVHLAG